MLRRYIPTLLLLTAVASAMVTGVVRAGDPPAADAVQQVAIFNYKFSPETLAVPAGTKVTWTNKDEVPHTVASSDKRFTSSTGLDTGEQYSYTFTTAGTYEYFCTLHPFMKGKIVVEASKATASETTKGG
jgi:amicyanin